MPEEIQAKLIEEEMKQSYLDYAMSVIVGRALPDVKDGLKPVHRRILYAMHDLGMFHNRPHKKSARIVGEVLGKYHPHGDQAVYDSLVRMAQEFSLRYPLIDGQGNFGSIDGDNAASMRYTEARLSKIAEELLKDIEKNTVEFIPNFDNSLKEPIVLPAKLPNLLINGSSGIAVGMATNIPPHNMREICDGTIALINNPDITTEELMMYIKGPDFPTSALILGKLGILQAYKTGRGKITLRAKTEIKDNKLIITEIPYMVNKASLIEHIADLVKDKKIEGITDIRDESDRKGLTIVIETRKSSNQEVILNQLYKLTSLQISFGIIMLALYDSQPIIMNLKQILSYYTDHRKDIITKRTQFDLDKAEKRMHIIEGLIIALSNIDKVIALIKKSTNPLIAKESLIKNYSLTDLQSQAILDMRLQRLTSLEQDKIKDEHKNLQKLIEELKSILASEQRILNIIKQELIELKETYKDERRTQILDVVEEIDTEDLIEEDDIVITSTYSGYIKQTPLEEYKQQRRGGQGIQATKTKEEDVVEHLFICNNHNYLLFFTNKGNIHWLKAYKIPSSSRYAKGSAIINLLKLDKEEKITSILPIAKFEEDLYLLFCTNRGILKKTKLESYSNPRKGGIKAIKLRDNDELVTVRLTPGALDMILATKKGMAVKFNEQDVRDTGRNASGVKGIKLKKDDEVIGLEVALSSASLLTVTEKGFGKRTSVDEYRLIKRGGSGVKNIKITEKNGNVIGIKTVKDQDEIMLISKNGIIIRVPVNNISVIGRSTQGVRIMKLKEKDKVVTLARVIINNS